jgi:alkaline phosphatase
MKKNKILLIALFSSFASAMRAKKTAKYVFLFIGDGMGNNAIYATELYKSSLENPIAIEPLAMSQFPAKTFMTTMSVNSLTTDSSAAATGYKTDNHVVAMDSTSQIATSNFDYFAGGGVHTIGNVNNKNSIAFSLSEKGYRYITNTEEIKKLKKGDTKIIAVNPGTYSGREYYWEIDKRKESISLAYLTKKGIELLANKKGFFMMVEGGKIDWTNHSNDLGSARHETLAFDDAIKVAVNFYNKHKEEILIIVTSDHKTGGLTLGTERSTGLRLDLFQHQKISAQEFERKLDVLKKLKRKVSFDEVLDSVTVDFGLDSGIKGLELVDKEKEWLQVAAYRKEFLGGQEVDPDRDYLDQSSGKSFTERVLTLLGGKAGIGWTTGGHTAATVPVKVIGIGEEYFRTTIDNTEINDIILKGMQIPNKQ